MYYFVLTQKIKQNRTTPNVKYLFVDIEMISEGHVELDFIVLGRVVHQLCFSDG